MNKKSLLVLCLAVLFLPAVPVAAAPPALFVDAELPSNAPGVGIDAARAIVRERAARVRFRVLEETVAALQAQPGGPAPRLNLNLFVDREAVAVLERVTSELEGTVSWIGRIEGVEDSQVTLVYGGGVLVGSVADASGFYRIRYAGNRVHVIEEVDVQALPPEVEPSAVEMLLPPGAEGDEPFLSPLAATLSTKAADNGSTFDVLVLYTAAARSAAGGTTAMQNLIALGVTETNQSFANSGVIPRLQLVRTSEIAYTESGLVETDRNRLQNPSDGHMDSAHSLRNTYRADLVKLIVNSGADGCGISYLMNGANNRDFETNGFAVTRRDCVSPNYTFGHELGHIMGCNHAPGDPTGTGAYSYSFGYKDPSRIFRTIMAYDCSSYCPRVLQWSNPYVYYNGRVTGTSTQNNASTINNVRGIIANFRQAGSPYTFGSCSWSAGIKESSGTYYTCPNSKVMTGRKHSGDENGTTYYHCCNAYRSGVQAVPYSLVWSSSIKESSGTAYTCPSGKVLVGRRHSGDENGYTMYQCAYLDFGGSTYYTDASTCSWSSGQKESSSNYVCAYDRVMAGRQHSGDENGTTWNYCCNLY